MVSRKRIAVALPIVTVVVGAIMLVAGARSKEVREFEASYPRRASPNGVTKEFTLEAAPAEIPLLDGRALKVWAYNRQVPGPILRVRLGETVRATLVNHLPQ